jgi:VWFA-related protein
MQTGPQFGSRMTISIGSGLTFLVPLLFVVLTVLGQSPDPTKSTSGGNNQETSQETGTTFKLRVNLVEVDVVVRDARGNPVPGLKQEDFHLYDQGKLQTITNFVVETPETRREAALGRATTPIGENSSVSARNTGSPDRFVAMMFDDMHLTGEDLAYARKSASEFLDTLAPSDRVGFYSTSGQFTQEFLGDKEELKRALRALIARPAHTSSPHDCPDVPYYMANQIETFHDSTAFGVIFDETLQCAFSGDATMGALAQRMAKSAIQETLALGRADINSVYDHVRAVLRRLAATPGERIMIFVSPGFSLGEDKNRLWQVVDQANRAKIVINTLDARGLYTADIAGGMPSPEAMKYHAAAQQDQSIVLGDLADGSGGTHLNNSNDIAGGMKRMGGAPSVSYMLGFSPQDQSTDGSFHKLKVELAMKLPYQIQARRGYYAPKKSDNPQEEASAEIDEAIFSQAEILEMPMELQTQYVKNTAADARLSILTRLGIKDIRFRKLDDRNCNVLTVVTAIFEDNGNYVLGENKSVNLKLTGPTYDHLLSSGLTLKSEFDLKPGKYMLRQVIREIEGAQMAARSVTVVIPN